ncbi:MAG: hypothetical protein ACD_9C00124G0009 [uncultured bacterium]|nr:MAG: hypothetical protein ACD_9C00124G0009 [uncultured bacterium]
MTFILEVNNKTAEKFPKKFFLEIFRRSMELADLQCLKNKSLELSVALVEEDEIEKINTQYRKKNSPTDVLSFCEYENMEEFCEKISKSQEQNIFIGELILCPKYIARNAREDRETFEYALAYIVAHGIFHLLGFEHGRKMFSLQQQIADQMQIKSVKL